MTLDDREKILLKERFASHWLKQKKWLEPQVSENYFSQYLSKKAKGNSLVFFEWLFEEHALNETQFQEAIQEYTQTLEWHCPSCHKVYLGKKEGEQPLACKNCSKTLNPPAKSSKKDPLLGSTLGACLISRKLGQGGMGSVYLAFHLRLQKWVALKILPHNPLQLENQVDRFLVEARSGSKLEHPNIVAVLDVGEEKNCYYMIQQYIEGQSLQSLLKQKKRLTLPEALPLIIELCTALAHAHQRNIIHRDIKPDNLLLDRENHLKIADFGLAKFLDTSQSLSITGTIMGTAHYMSPEQAQGNKKLDGRTDIYSVGVTLYQMLTGELPYASTENDSLMTILYRHVHDPIPLAHKIQPDLDPLFSDFICKCMAKKPEDRFQNFNEFLDQIKNYKITKIIKPQSLSLKDEKEASVLPALAPREKTLPPSSPFWKHKKFWKVALPLLFILLFFNGIQKQKKKALSLASHQENPSLQIPDHTTFPPLSSPPSLSTDLEALSAYLKTLKIGLVEHPQEEEKIKELQTKITPLVLERFENILKMLQRDYPEQSVGSSKKQLKELLSFSENLKEFFPKNFPQAQKPLNLLACLKKEIEWAEMLWSGNLESAKDRLQALKQEYPEWIPPEALIQKQIEAEALYQKEILISNFLKSIETRNIELFANTFQQWKPFQEEENPFLSFPEDYQKILTGLRQESETFLPYFQTLFLIEEKEEEMLFLGELLEEALPEELFQKNNPLEEGSKISQRKQDRTFILRLKEALQEKDKLAFTEVLKEIDQQILATKGSSKIRLQKRFQRYFQEQEEEIFTLFLPQEEEGTQEAALQEIPTFQLIQRYAPDWPQDPLKKAQLLQDPSKIALDPEKGETKTLSLLPEDIQELEAYIRKNRSKNKNWQFSLEAFEVLQHRAKLHFEKFYQKAEELLKKEAFEEARFFLPFLREKELFAGFSLLHKHFKAQIQEDRSLSHFYAYEQLRKLLEEEIKALFYKESTYERCLEIFHILYHCEHPDFALMEYTIYLSFKSHKKREGTAYLTLNMFLILLNSSKKYLEILQQQQKHFLNSSLKSFVWNKQNPWFSTAVFQEEKRTFIFLLEPYWIFPPPPSTELPFLQKQKEFKEISLSFCCFLALQHRLSKKQKIVKTPFTETQMIEMLFRPYSLKGNEYLQLFEKEVFGAFKTTK